jgi:hypothetical protein
MKNHAIAGRGTLIEVVDGPGNRQAARQACIGRGTANGLAEYAEKLDRIDPHRCITFVGQTEIGLPLRPKRSWYRDAHDDWQKDAAIRNAVNLSASSPGKRKDEENNNHSLLETHSFVPPEAYGYSVEQDACPLSRAILLLFVPPGSIAEDGNKLEFCRAVQAAAGDKAPVTS